MRVASFVGFAGTCTACGLVALAVGFSPAPFLSADPALHWSLWLVVALYAGGVAFYATGWPEEWLARRRADRALLLASYLGASHQLMHVCVLAAAALNAWCMQRTSELSQVLTQCEP